LIELYGRTRSAQYLLSHRFYIQSGKLGEHTKKIGLPRAKNKELILEHIRRNGKGNVAEFRQIFPELSATDIANLVQDLRKSGLIERVGEKRWSFWKLKK
jgi:predicted HTH transcriptional regulator